jgi:hypothetical protein
LHPTFLRRNNVIISASDKLPFVMKDEVLRDLSQRTYYTLIRESEGVEQKQRGGLPSVRMVWAGRDRERIIMPLDPSAWQVALNAPQVKAEPTPPQPAPTPPKQPKPILLVRFSARRLKNGLLELNRQVRNQSDAPIEDA